jgi:hypothetical protein
VDGHRGYPDEPEPSWYTGQSQYATPAHNGRSPYDSGVHERPSGAFRLPEQRENDYAAQSPYGDPMTTTGGHSRSIADPGAGPRDEVRMPVRGPEYPAVRPTSSSAPASSGPAPGSPAASYQQPMTVVPPVTPPAADRVYRTRRPVTAVVLAALTLLLLLPTLMLLVEATFGAGDPSARAVVPAVLLTMGLPLTGYGLYALAAGGPVGREVWLRPPLAYLPVGLVLLLAAGLAVA